MGKMMIADVRKSGPMDISLTAMIFDMIKLVTKIAVTTGSHLDFIIIPLLVCPGRTALLQF